MQVCSEEVKLNDLRQASGGVKLARRARAQRECAMGRRRVCEGRDATHDERLVRTTFFLSYSLLSASSTEPSVPSVVRSDAVRPLWCQ